MFFQSWTFAVFFLVFYAVYLAVQRSRLRVPWLLAASYVFYGWWHPLWPALLLWSTTVDYLAVIGMDRTRWRRSWLLVSVLNNLGLLGFFKYGNFVVENLNGLLALVGVPYGLARPDVTFVTGGLNSLLGRSGVPYALPALDFLLPIGLSFYIFQSLSYTIDFYRGQVERERSFLRYAAFVSMFPQLLSGPIERARNLLPQLRQPPRISREDVSEGLSLFVLGLFKKKALADYFALYVNQVFDAPREYQAPALMLAAFAFAWQIYFDFSGYTDMARGLARLMGIRLMLNFNNPYLANGLGDFWRRWHVSLSTWFRDYVYIPLGGNRRGEVRTYVNMCLTMLISGLWHGAMWTFVIWGALHALGRVVTRGLEATTFYQQRVPTLVKQLGTFAFVTFAWIFFKAASVSDAWLIVSRIFISGWADPRCPLLLLALALAVWAYQFAYESAGRWVLALPPVRVALVVGMLFWVAVFTGSGEQAFIYFQF